MLKNRKSKILPPRENKLTLINVVAQNCDFQALELLIMWSCIAFNSIGGAGESDSRTCSGRECNCRCFSNEVRNDSDYVRALICL